MKKIIILLFVLLTVGCGKVQIEEYEIEQNFKTDEHIEKIDSKDIAITQSIMYPKISETTWANDFNLAIENKLNNIVEKYRTIVTNEDKIIIIDWSYKIKRKDDQYISILFDGFYNIGGPSLKNISETITYNIKNKEVYIKTLDFVKDKDKFLEIVKISNEELEKSISYITEKELVILSEDKNESKITLDLLKDTLKI